MVLVQNLVAALYWPHPLVRILNRELAKAREEVCDNFVLAGTEAPAYSRTLLSLAELVQQPDAMPGSVGFFTDRWKLEHRVAGLLDTRRDRTTFLNKRDWVLVAANSAALAVLMCLATITMATAQVNDNHDTNEAVFDETPTTVSGIVSAPGDKDGAPIGDAKPQSRERTSTSVSGRVLNSNGQPVAAPLWVGGPGRSGQWLRSPMRVAWNRVGKSAADGHFEITIPQPENESATSKASVVRLAATADGLGFAWTDVAVGKTADEVTLRMVKDTPIRGRIVTLDGTPAANVELNVVAVTAPDSLPDSSEIISSARSAQEFTPIGRLGPEEVHSQNPSSPIAMEDSSFPDWEASVTCDWRHWVTVWQQPGCRSSHERNRATVPTVRSRYAQDCEKAATLPNSRMSLFLGESLAERLWIKPTENRFPM